MSTSSAARSSIATGHRPRFTVFVSRDDRALAVRAPGLGSTARLGAIDPEVEPFKPQLEQAKIYVLDMSKLRTGDRLNHGKFAESPEVVQLIGTRLIAGQPITDSGRAGRASGSDHGRHGHDRGNRRGPRAISAPLAVIDPKTRQNIQSTVPTTSRQSAARHRRCRNRGCRGRDEMARQTDDEVVPATVAAANTIRAFYERHPYPGPLNGTL